MSKTILGRYGNNRGHWVGDGFPVRSLFSYNSLGGHISPFLLMDYGAPTDIAPSDTPRGVDEHPHKGFETVTIVYQGELEHADSAGNSGVIGPGDVQWMTAASGIVHKEKWGREFTRRGGTLEFIQLWVNLPAKHKSAQPGYQSLEAAEIPVVALPGGGTARVIAGEMDGVTGPARTFSPVNVWDIRIPAGSEVTFQFPDGEGVALFLRSGEAVVNGGDTLRAADFAMLDTAGETVTVRANEATSVVVLNGEPLDEPVAAYGPFVMNTEAEIRQAFADYRAGRFGK
jgi:redox-sensitive bicupin YhaK (pirin superfamily)